MLDHLLALLGLTQRSGRDQLSPQLGSRIRRALDIGWLNLGRSASKHHDEPATPPGPATGGPAAITPASASTGNPTSQVQTAFEDFDCIDSYWPINPAAAATIFQTGEMIGLGADGYATHMDDTAAKKFLGTFVGPHYVWDATTPGYPRVRVRLPRRFSMPLVDKTGAPINCSRVTDMGSKVYAYDSGHVTMDVTGVVNVTNVVGYIENLVGDSSTSTIPDALTGQPWIRPLLLGQT
jgi:hypothetical protein